MMKNEEKQIIKTHPIKYFAAAMKKVMYIMPAEKDLMHKGSEIS